GIPGSGQIVPVRIVGADKVDLPGSRPFLQPLLAMNSVCGSGVFLEVDECFHVVLFRKPIDQTLLVLKNTRLDVACHAHIERAPWFACENVDEKALRHSSLPQAAFSTKLGRPHEAGDDGY